MSVRATGFEPALPRCYQLLTVGIHRRDSNPHLPGVYQLTYAPIMCAVTNVLRMNESFGKAILSLYYTYFKLKSRSFLTAETKKDKLKMPPAWKHPSFPGGWDGGCPFAGSRSRRFIQLLLSLVSEGTIKAAMSKRPGISPGLLL